MCERDVSVICICNLIFLAGWRSSAMKDTGCCQAGVGWPSDVRAEIGSSPRRASWRIMTSSATVSGSPMTHINWYNVLCHMITLKTLLASNLAQIMTASKMVSLCSNNLKMTKSSLCGSTVKQKTITRRDEGPVVTYKWGKTMEWYRGSVSILRMFCGERHYIIIQYILGTLGGDLTNYPRPHFEITSRIH